MDWNGKVYLWSVSTGELLKSTTDGPSCARLVWEARNGWNDGEDEGTESNNKKPRNAVVGQNVYICDPTENGNLFEKVGRFDNEVEGWGVDSKEGLWICFCSRILARVAMITESSGALQNRENEVTR